MRPFIIILLLKCKWGVTKQKIIKTNKQPPTYQGGFMWLSRLWITFALACEDILMWAFPGRETMGYTWAHKQYEGTHLTPSNVFPLRRPVETLLSWFSSVSAPPPHTHTHYKPITGWDPFCLSPLSTYGRTSLCQSRPSLLCPNKQNLLQWGSDGWREAGERRMQKQNIKQWEMPSNRVIIQ